MSKKQLLKRSAGKVWTGIVYVWNRPMIISGILLIVAIFLFNAIIRQTFKPYTNCNYLIVTRMGMNAFFCNGTSVSEPFFGTKIFDMPGLSSIIDKPLELVRTVIAWSVVIFFAFLSLYLTIFVNAFKSVVKILTLNKEEWRRLMASMQIWFLFFVTFGAIFYFTVIR